MRNLDVKLLWEAFVGQELWPYDVETYLDF